MTLTPEAPPVGCSLIEYDTVVNKDPDLEFFQRRGADCWRLCAVAGSSFVFQRNMPAHGPVLDYEIPDCNDAAAVKMWLNTCGQSGWDLCGIYGRSFVFVRPKSLIHWAVM